MEMRAFQEMMKPKLGDNKDCVCIIPGRPPIKIFVDADEIQFEVEAPKFKPNKNIGISFSTVRYVSIVYKDGQKRRRLIEVYWPYGFTDDVTFDTIEEAKEKLQHMAYLVKEELENAYYAGVESLKHFKLNLDEVCEKFAYQEEGEDEYIVKPV